MDFNKLLKTYEQKIDGVCKRICDSTRPHKIEFEDMKQEALIKLWQLSLEGITERKVILASIRNCLLDYVKHEKLNPLTYAISLDKLLDELIED
jgi:DNA-directed RNA polymerase specialized sigma24 family protein